MNKKRTVLTFVLISMCSIAYSDGLSEHCKELPDHLKTCTIYSCAYERLVISDSDKKINAAYKVLGRAEDNRCGYTVSMNEDPILTCNLSDESVAVFLKIMAMQIDGTFQENSKQLKQALTTGNLDGIDPDFIQASTQFSQVMASDECQPSTPPQTP